jgi:hypothetical protein
MHGSKHDVPATVDHGGVVIREAEWGDMNVSLERFPAGTVTAPLFRGLPDDGCQCPRWGYVVKGRVRLIYRDREEVVSAGDAYYMAPGHTTAFDEDTEIVEFGPKGEYQKTIEFASRNMATMQQG